MAARAYPTSSVKSAGERCILPDAKKWQVILGGKFQLETSMCNLANTNSTTHRTLLTFCASIWLAITLLAVPATATTYLSAEPIPSQDVVGQENLGKMLAIGYANLELWSRKLLHECGIVRNVIDVLSEHAAIRTIEARRNTQVRVGAGGFEGVTNPSFVFTIQDSGRLGASAADISVLSNALGYVLSQGGTAHFSPDDPNAYDFPLDFAVITIKGTLTGREAKQFFKSLGKIDPALFSGTLAGFTQIDFEGSRRNNSMLFLQPNVTKAQFVSGLAQAADAAHGADYVTLDRQGRPTTDQAGIAFPGNDWIAFPNGEQMPSPLRSCGNVSDTETTAPIPCRRLARTCRAIGQTPLETVCRTFLVR
jgi:hypothetical protein